MNDDIQALYARLLKAAIAWRTAVAEARCGECGVRIHRTEEELALESVITTIERTEFEAEAPTRPKGSPVQRARRPSSRPPKKT
jgi:hypothetical protein